MKKLLLLIFISVIVLSGCGEGDVSSTSDEYPIGYEVVTAQMIDGYYLYEIRNIETGCHFAYAPDSSIEAINHEVNGMSIPYCTKE